MPNEFTYLAPDGANDERRNWSKCKACGEPILWCRTSKNNKAIPFNVSPPVIETVSYGAQKVSAALVHWETCEKRDEARRTAPAAARVRKTDTEDGVF